jgi:putative membrane protein
MATQRATAPSPTDLSQQRTNPSIDRTHPPDERTSLALDRTLLAHERTLMAWVRTAVSLISFGFTIYKFFQYLREGEQIAPARTLFGPRIFALAMISLGLVALVLALIEHGHQMRALQARFSQYGPLPRSTASAVAWIVTTLGILALILVALRQ